MYKTHLLLSFTTTKIHDKLNNSFEHGYISYGTVAQGLRRFSSGREL